MVPLGRGTGGAGGSSHSVVDKVIVKLLPGALALVAAERHATANAAKGVISARARSIAIVIVGAPASGPSL